MQLSATAMRRESARSRSSTSAARSASPSPYTHFPTRSRSAIAASARSASARAGGRSRTVSRRSTPSNPGMKASGTPSGSFASSPNASASALSAIPWVRSVRERTTVPPAPRSRSRGSSTSRVIPRNSRGTPGSMATHRPAASSSQMPGAEPCAFASTIAPSGIIACSRFVAGSSPGQPRAFQRWRSDSSIAWSRRIARPKWAASAGLVRSSAVGPSPPLVITAPVRCIPSATAETMAAASSPTAQRRTTWTPTSAASRAKNAEFVSTVKPSSSSSPTVTSSTSTVVSGRPAR